MLDDEYLAHLEQLSANGDPPPWSAMWEGRDHDSGDSFIRVGDRSNRREDIYVVRDSGPANLQNLELVAEARNALPLLIAEIWRLRAERDGLILGSG